MCFCFFMKSKQTIQWEDTEPFVAPITEGTVIKVYDGDTITIASKLPYLGSPLYRFSVRLAGIDTPEMHGTEVERAILARNTLSNLILNKKVKLENVCTEKYGRLLADVYLDDLHINKWMIDHKHAVPYFGGKKE
jgi:micrococcal nuclease